MHVLPDLVRAGDQLASQWVGLFRSPGPRFHNFSASQENREGLLRRFVWLLKTAEPATMVASNVEAGVNASLPLAFSAQKKWRSSCGILQQARGGSVAEQGKI